MTGSMDDVIKQFRGAIQSAGLEPPAVIEGDGKLHRFSTNCKPDDDAGWYIFFADGIPAGYFGDWRTGHSHTWRANGCTYSAEEEAAHCERVEAMRRVREAEEQRRHAEARERATAIWNAAQPAPDDHPYLRAKGVKSYGLRLQKGQLVVPLCDTCGELQSLHFIGPDGSKLFLAGGRTVRCYFVIGKPALIFVVCEGYATGASIHEATGYPVVVAFNCGNLLAVADAVKAQYPDAHLVIAADDDAEKEGNPGLTAATEAARAVIALLAVPDFGSNRPVGATDFNDLHKVAGLEAVRACIAAAKSVEATQETDAEAILRLAKLSPMEYDRIRKSDAERLGLRVETLDAEVRRVRAGPTGQTDAGKAVLFPEIDPWPEPVNGVALLDDLAACARRYAVVPKHADTAIALWVAHTYLLDAFDVSPVLALVSPEKRCGKTTVLTLISRLVHRALSCANITPASLFRAVEAWQPTLLIDEADTFLGGFNELRGILNSGHARETAYVIRTVGDDHEPRRFATWGAKTIALIGKLPDTLHDRAIAINLRRKLPDEKTEKLRHADKVLFETLRQRCVRFAQDIVNVVDSAQPTLPDSLHDRAADNWEPMLAIADAAGGEWPAKARAAALALSGAMAEQDDSRPIMLLADIRQVFTSKEVDRLSTADLIDALVEMEDQPWCEYSHVEYGHGEPISPRQLSNMLSQFGIAPKDIRIGSKIVKGYKLERFEDAFSRYLTPQQARQRYKPAPEGDSRESASATGGPSSRNEKSSETASAKGCSAVADDEVGTGGGADADADDPASELVQ